MGESAEREQEEEDRRWNQKHQQIEDIAQKLKNGGGDMESKIEAARYIRKMVRSISSSNHSSASKTRSRFAAAGVIPPLISMLLSSNLLAIHSSLLALLNLAVRNERNKVRIVTSGAIPPLVELLKFHNSSLRELATAAILTLSAAAQNKPTIAASGAAPLLILILSSGSVQGKVDAVTVLHNLSSCTESSSLSILDARAVPPLINLLKECKKYSKFAEKTSALIEILSKSEQGQVAISATDGGILTLVETVEDGSLVSTEHAVGALLALCRSCRSKHRELILNEGAIPGLLRLTVYGTPAAQERSRTLLDLLRDSPKEMRLDSSVLERMVYDIAKRVDGADKATAETAKRLLQDMVQRSMELSMSRIQHKAASCTPSEIPNKVNELRNMR